MRWVGWRTEVANPGGINKALPRWQFLWHALKTDSLNSILCLEQIPQDADVYRFRGSRPPGSVCTECKAILDQNPEQIGIAND